MNGGLLDGYWAIRASGEGREVVARDGLPARDACIKGFAELDGRDSCAQVRSNTHYIDLDSGKQREADLVASWVKYNGDFAFLVTLTVECKSTTEPWVVFKRDSYGSIEGSLFDPSYSHVQNVTPELDFASLSVLIDLEGLLVDNLPEGMSVPLDGYAIVTAFKGRDSANSAVLEVLSSAKGAGLPVESELGMRKWCAYSVPDQEAALELLIAQATADVGSASVGTVGEILRRWVTRIRSGRDLPPGKAEVGTRWQDDASYERPGWRARGAPDNFLR